MKIELVSIKTLTRDPENARKHSERNVKVIGASLEKFGQRKPIVVWKNIVLAGNGTLEAAEKIGWEKVSITRAPSEWTFDEARAYALTDNRTSDLSDWDHSMLADQLVELDNVGWDVEELGFATLEPPTNPYQEWEGMPDFNQTSKESDFKVTVHFKNEDDVDAFFAIIERPKKASMWYPEGDGHIGSSVFERYVSE